MKNNNQIEAQNFVDFTTSRCRLVHQMISFHTLPLIRQNSEQLQTHLQQPKMKPVIETLSWFENDQHITFNFNLASYLKTAHKLFLPFDVIEDFFRWIAVLIYEPPENHRHYSYRNHQISSFLLSLSSF